MILLLLLALQVEAPPEPAPKPVTHPVILVVDSEFRSTPQWRGMAKELLQHALEPANIRLRLVGESFWNAPPETNSLPDMLTEARKTMHKNSTEIVVLVTGRKSASKGVREDMDGYALHSAPWVIIKQDRKDKMLLSLRHELGHVFGLPHVPGRSVMAAKSGHRTLEFSKEALEFLGAAKTVDFADSIPFAGADIEVIADYYLAWNTQGASDPVQMKRAGQRLLSDGRSTKAVFLLEAASKHRPRDPEMWFVLARAREEAGLKRPAYSAYRKSLIYNPASVYADSARSAISRLGAPPSPK